MVVGAEINCVMHEFENFKKIEKEFIKDLNEFYPDNDGAEYFFGFKYQDTVFFHIRISYFDESTLTTIVRDFEVDIGDCLHNLISSLKNLDDIYKSEIIDLDQKDLNLMKELKKKLENNG